MWVVHSEMRGLINEADEIEQIERRAADEDSKLATDTRVRVNRALERLKEVVGDAAKEEIEDLSKSVSRMKRWKIS